MINIDPPCKKINSNPNEIKEKKAIYKTMKTRSQIKKEQEQEQEQEKKETIEPVNAISEPDDNNEDEPLQYAVDIDFDEAKKAWRANKIVLKNGCFRYKKTIRTKTI
jgi:hypothetical protein